MKYMNAEDAMIAQGDKPRKSERQDSHHSDRGKKLAQTSD